MKTQLILSLVVLTSIGCCRKGPGGAAGTDGQNGTPGISILFNTAIAEPSICANGGTVLLAGEDENKNGLLEISEMDSIVPICNGLNGTNGQDGADAPNSPFQPVAIESACGGDINNPHNEIFIRLSNGILIGTVSQNASGLNTHLGVVAPGNYYSTGSNGANCSFTVNADGSITR